METVRGDQTEKSQASSYDAEMVSGVLGFWSFPIGGVAFSTPVSMVSEARLISRRYESAVSEAIQELLQPGMNCIDGGAHVGYFSMLFSRMIGSGGTVYSFEPHPKNFALLVNNTKKRRYSNILPLPLALSDKSGDTELFESVSSTGHSIYRLDKKATGRMARVKSVSLDDFLAERGNPPIHLLKLDIQGAEQAALQGATRLLRDSPDLILMLELSSPDFSPCGADPLAILELLRAHCFDINIVDWRKGCTVLDDDSLTTYLTQEEYINILAQKKGQS